MNSSTFDWWEELVHNVQLAGDLNVQRLDDMEMD